MAVASQEILRYFRPDCCIAATRITINVMREFGIAAEPIPTQLIVGNREWARRVVDQKETIPKEVRQWCERTGAWSVGVGFGSDSGKPGYDGHLVAYLPVQNCLIDASISQCNRPERNIILPSVLVVHSIRQHFLRGETTGTMRLDGLHIEYQRHNNLEFRKSRDWTEHKRHKEPTKAIIAAIHRSL